MTRQITINNTEGFAARIQNRGQSNGTQTVELYKDGVLVTDEANLTLTPDETAYVLEAPTVFSNALHQQVLTMEVVTANMTRTIEVLIDAIPDGAVDNFEAVLYEDQSRTLSDYYNDVGNVAALTFQRQQNTVLEGNNSLELEGDDAPAKVISTGVADLPNTPTQGDSFRVKFQSGRADTILAFRYGVQDSSNYYELRLRIADNEIQLYKDGAQQAATAATLSQGTTYDPTLAWAGDGQQTLTVNDDGGTDQSVSFTDTEYTSGEIGWVATRSEFINPLMFADNARII